MTSRTMRRRLHHGDVDGKKREHLVAADLDDLNEPLLGNNDEYRAKQLEVQRLEDILYDEKRKESLHWTFLFSHIISEWAQWLAKLILGSGSFIARILMSPSTPGNFLPPPLTPLQEARLGTLQKRLEVPFDGSCLEHQDALRELWRSAYPNRELPGLKSELWKEMGWQGNDPSTDFRGGGFISLQNLIFFAHTYPEAFQNLLNKKDGSRAEWEYPFAVAGINISFMLVQMLDIQSGLPTSLSGMRFLQFLSNDESAFDELFCVAFKLLDVHWLARRASYMEFNEVMKSTRVQLERELAIEDVTCVKDLPAYNLLR
uniref:ELMO domain-containing protein A n=1 Tax=Erigeron canadensis TaxID=72917 RepID=UPI001CB8AB7C|nr:ELMO domain-containing protein A [Erigeron canadensis]